MSSWSAIAALGEEIPDIGPYITAGETIYGILKGSGDSTSLTDISNQLNAIAAELSAAINALTAAVQYQTAMQYWAQYQTTLTNIANAFNALQADCNSAIVEDGVIYLYTPTKTPLLAWCSTGPTSVTNPILSNEVVTGSLSVLADSIEAYFIMFNPNTGQATGDALHAWQQVCQTAAADQISGFAQQPPYTITIAFMQQIYGMLGAISYLYQLSLSQWLAANPGDNTYRPLSSVMEQIGSITTATSVWQWFGQTLAGWASADSPTGTLCTTTSGYGQGLPSQNVGTMLPGANWVNKQITLVNQNYFTAPQNGYIAGIQLNISDHFQSNRIQSNEAPFGPYLTNQIYLSVLYATVSAGPVFTPAAWTPAPPDPSTFRPGDPFAWGPGAGSEPANYFGHFNVAYCNAPASPGPNKYYVVNAVTLVSASNDTLALQVGYGLLDLSNPAAPTISSGPVISPTVGTVVPIMGDDDNWPNTVNYIDMRPAGSSNYSPISNATLIATNPVGSGNAIGVAVQNAVPLYTQTGFQPLTQFGVAAPPPAPAPAPAA